MGFTTANSAQDDPRESCSRTEIGYSRHGGRFLFLFFSFSFFSSLFKKIIGKAREMKSAAHSIFLVWQCEVPAAVAGVYVAAVPVTEFTPSAGWARPPLELVRPRGQAAFVPTPLQLNFRI